MDTKKHLMFFMIFSWFCALTANGIKIADNENTNPQKVSKPDEDTCVNPLCKCEHPCKCGSECKCK